MGCLVVRAYFSVNYLKQIGTVYRFEDLCMFQKIWSEFNEFE